MSLATHETLTRPNITARADRAAGVAAFEKTEAQTARFSSTCEKALVGALFAAVVGTALASGAVEPWSIALFELLAIALIILWTAKSISNRRLSIRAPSEALPFALLVGLGAIQSVSINNAAGNVASLSLDVEATRSAVLAMFSLLVCFIVAANFVVGRKRIRAFVRSLVLYGLAMAIFALIQYLSSGGQSYWLRPLSSGVTWFGPFVNHAHYAGYMALLIPLPVALMMNKAVRSEERLLFGFAAAAMALSVVISLSRGGMIAVASELLFLTVAGSRPRRGSSPAGDRYSDRESPGWSRLKTVAGVGIVIIAIGAGVLWMGPEPLANRIGKGNSSAAGQGESFSQSRGWIWRDSIRVFEAHPLLGVGIGAFETAFPIYSRSDGSLLVSQSHNDYLQVLADCGIGGGILAVWFVAAVGLAVFRGLRSHDPLSRSLSIGCGAAILGMLVHSVFDFNLQLPSTALLFLIVCAMASTTGARRRDNEPKQGATHNIAMESAQADAEPGLPLEVLTR